MATAVSAVLTISPLTFQAVADDQVPVTEQSSGATPSAETSAETSPETAAEPTAQPTAEPTAEPTQSEGPTSSPDSTVSPTDQPAGPGQQAKGGQAFASPVQSLAPLQCNTVYSVQGASPRNLWSVDTSTGTQTSVGTFAVSGTNSNNLNGLGVSADGGEAYGVLPNASDSGRSIYKHDRAAETTTNVGAGVASAVTTHGAVNPANGFYYYGGLSGSTLNIYGFNTTTNTSIGLVASGTIPNGGGNGDWAFDTAGRLYVVAGTAGNNVMSVVDQAIPSTSQATPVTITATQIAVSTAPAAINGIAFGGDGYLYIASASVIYRINPSSGATVSSASLSQSGSVDLASCSVPSTIEVRKNFPDGRAASSDQATLSISGGGLASPVTATTAGTDPGMQSDPTETAGPVLGLNGNTYTISESGAGTGAGYVASWVCVNSSTGATLASGTGTTGSLTLPAGTATVPALCTFTNNLGNRDFGDAAASFGTTSVDGGPRHSLVGYDSAARTSSLMLGATVDHETDGEAGALANGDDAAGIDDENALPSFTITPGATTATATIPVVNSTGSGATLYGWIDANSNGTFQAGEAAVVGVPNGATGATLSWTGLTAATDGAQPVVRLRLTSANLTDSADTANLDERSQGGAPDGEVEDSLATVATTLPEDCANPFVETFGAGVGRAALPTGQTTYTYASTGSVQDGSYALTPGIDTSYGGWWHTGPDHTPGDTNGRAMLVNAAFAPGKFFTKTFTGLVVGSRYDFSAWITNANNAGSTILPNVRFQVVDPATGQVLATADSGDISNKASLVWDRFALGFTATQTTVRLELVNNAPGGGGNDLAIDDVGVGPVCEYGDAPDSYGTSSAVDGPVHGRGAGLRLGATVDYEGDGQPSAEASGDDTEATDDEDGVSASIIETAGESTTVQVSATNDTETAATLAGWIDLNNNGTFETGERVTANVPAGSGTATYSLTFPTPTVAGNSYARFRILPGSVANPLPTGAADAGEVEDYPVSFQPGTSLFDGCTSVLTFDSDNMGWRAATVSGGDLTPKLGPIPVGWSATAGNPAGGLIENDLDGWNTELWTPALVASGYSTDYSPLLGTTVQFDYKNNTGIGLNVYMGVVGTNGKAYYFNFRPQILNSKAWNRIRVPIDATKWVTQFQNGVGATGPAPTAAEFAAALASVERFVFSIEGQTGPDTTQFDNFGQACDDFGDAPASYGTTSGGQQPSHRPDSTGPLLRLGATVDIESAPTVNAAASGDDTVGIDDEDGVGPITITTGSPSSVTVTATNDGSGPATLAGWIDLDKSGTFDANERAVVTVPAGSAGSSFALSFGAATTTQPTYARFRLYPGSVTDPQPLGPVDGGEIEDHPVTTTTPALGITKASDATDSAGPGTTVHYTVTLTNTGTGAFTASNPARLMDDLTGVLDDAIYQGDAVATVDGSAVTAPTYAEPRLSWSGPLAAGKSVVVTYSVLLKGGGDGHVRNTAFGPRTENPVPTPDCAATSLPCAPHVYELPKLTITKRANRTQLPAVGQTIVYTVTVTNTGLGDYTVDHPATFTDDLSAVLDDTTPPTPADISVSRGTATFTSPDLSWTGTLPAGESATITYRLTYTGAGDHQLDNLACVPITEAQDPFDPCRTVSVPGSGLRHHKSVDPASGTPVEVGQLLTYTLTFENVGSTDATVDTTDDLTDVLDDAQIVGTPVAGPGLTASIAGNQLEIDGTVPAGESRTVTYQVQVRPFAQQGDHELANVLACEPGEPAGCAPETTSNPVRHLTLTKTSNATAESRPGDQVTYTVTVTNVGAGDWTAADPATVVDDLSGVLDDATYDGATTVSSGATSYAAPRLTWSGALVHGDSVTIQYTVSLTGGGDGDVDNVVWQPGPGGPGPKPDCASTARPCAEHGYDLPKLTIRKTSNRAQLPAAGQKITYTVTVTNPGPGDYTATNPATFADDLSDVVDDASFDAGSITASTGSAAFDGTTLSWSGVLAAGDSATVTYTLTYEDNATGNHVVDNHACIPLEDALDPADRCRTVHTPGSGLRQTKRVDPRSGTPVVEGQVLTYTLTFENVGPADAAVDTFDDLADVVDDATLDQASVTATPGLTATPTPAGDRIDITGTVPTGQTLTVTYQVMVKPFADQGDHVVTNALACQPGDPQPCEPTSTSNPVRHLTLTKTSDATVDSRPGDTVSYTVRLTNDGTGDYTAADPATLVDDLTGVLDDGTFNGVANASQGPAPTYTAPRLVWSGPLAAGDHVRVTYEVVLKGGGDGVVRNVTWAPSGTPGPTPDCATTGLPCDSESFDLPKLTVAKTANRSTLPATGQTVTYTVVVTNPGPGTYTAAEPASFSDDLSDVLDDATLGPDPVTASTGTASINGTTLSWSGVLAPAESATVTYTVTYRASGDHRLDNTACIPAAEALDPVDSCDRVQVPGSGLVHRKSVDPASGTPVEVGQLLTYTLTFDNTAGQAAASVDTTDDLSDVLDDAEPVGTPVAGAGLTADLSGTELTVTGSVPGGATRTVTYQVRVRPFGQQRDHHLVNALACEAGEPDPCAPETTSNPVRHVVLTKVKSAPTEPDTGDQVTYTVTVHNDGTGDWTAEDPATVVDDLTGVLDDAIWDGTAAASSGQLSFSSPELTWTGALPHGATVTVTYTVTVTNLGDHRMRNTARVPDCDEPSCNPPEVDTPLPHVVPAKTSDPASTEPVESGDVVTYTLTWTNDGEAPGVVDSTDDLTGVLDDADVVQEPTSSDPAVTATRTGSTLRIVGQIADGQTVTVTYQVRVKPSGQHGDNRLANVLTQDTPQVTCSGGTCTPVPPPSTEHPVGDLDDWKTVDPATGSTVQAGRRLTYTLHFANTGHAPVDVDRVDDLTGVLDDATLVTGPTSSSPALTVSGPTGGRMAITGTLASDVVATVTYVVEVKPNGQRGDDRIGNFLLSPGETPPTSCSGTGRLDCTVNHVSDIEVIKTSSPDSGGKVEVGDKITYTLTFRNVAKNVDAAAALVDQVDHLDDVLDDASWTSGPSVSSSALKASRSGNELRVTGALAPSEVVTVKYAVTVNNDGNGKVTNVIAAAGEDPVCAAGATTCTSQAVSSGSTGDGDGDDGDDGDQVSGNQGDGLPDTGSPLGWWLPPVGLFSLLLGLGLLLRERRRKAGPAGG